MPEPYFLRKQETIAVMIVDNNYPYQRLFYSAWKVLRVLKYSVVFPEFIEVDLNLVRKLEEATRQMINHVAKSTKSKGGVGGGVSVDVEWEGTDNNRCTLSVFPRNSKYIIKIERDDLHNVMISLPGMTFSDIPSLNQVHHICGQVVKIAASMRVIS
jgi:hypothetical protein